MRAETSPFLSEHTVHINGFLFLFPWSLCDTYCLPGDRRSCDVIPRSAQVRNDTFTIMTHDARVHRHRSQRHDLTHDHRPVDLVPSPAVRSEKIRSNARSGGSGDRVQIFIRQERGEQVTVGCEASTPPSSVPSAKMSRMRPRICDRRCSMQTYRRKELMHPFRQCEAATCSLSVLQHVILFPSHRVSNKAQRKKLHTVRQIWSR